MGNKVLLIDDSVTIHRVIDLSIDAERFEITKVFTKEDAEQKLSSDQYDFILLDNKLEDIYPVDFIQKIRDMQQEARVILLVGAFEKFSDEERQSLNADDFLIKPFNSQSLNEVLFAGGDSGAEIVNLPQDELPEDPEQLTNFIDNLPISDNNREEVIEDSEEVPEPVGDDFVVQGEAYDNVVFNKEKYLTNLEDVQSDDLLEDATAYVEDLIETDDEGNGIIPIVEESDDSDEEEVEEVAETEEVESTEETEETIDEELPETVYEDTAEAETETEPELEVDTETIVDEETEVDSDADADASEVEDVLDEDIYGEGINLAEFEKALDIIEDGDQEVDSIESEMQSNAEFTKEELIEMVKSTIDKDMLREVVTEALSDLIKEAVMDIIPELGEKFIKEEIERLKNDE